MEKLNCWEYKKCGRQIGGEKAKELGICPASTHESTHKVNNGRLGGRCCWAIAGTLCEGTVQGSFAAKEGNCMKCEFYKLVHQEEGEEIMRTSQILAVIHARAAKHL
jgi:hypothetical protein